MGARLSLILPFVLLAGCAAGPFGPRAAERPEVLTPAAETPRPAARPGAVRPPQGARTAEALDSTTPAERAAALAPAAGGRVLGRTLASRGDPVQPGFWMATPLVTAAVPGQVRDAASGATVRLGLRPSGGAAGSGSQMSLAAFRALGLPLTALAELEVLAE